MEYHPQQRCYRAGGAVKEITCTVQAALTAKDTYSLKNALWVLSRAGKEASFVIPEGKHIANVIAHRGRTLYRIAEDLGDQKMKAHENFFLEQIKPLERYAWELERRSYNSCLDQIYKTKEPDKLPSIPKKVIATVKKEKEKRAKAAKANHAKWMAKFKKSSK